MEKTVLQVKDITKVFPHPETPVVANDHVNLTLNEGEILAVVGENGTGKSTLMNILYGMLQPDSGEILLDGKAVRIRSPREAIANGIGMVHQHFMLVPSFTVAQNLVFSFEPTKHGVFVDEAKAIEITKEISQRYGLQIDPTRKIQDCPLSMQQRVEILKILFHGAKILIFDEPTAVLTPAESAELFRAFRELKADGRSIIFITHKLREVMDVADRVTVMRKGKVVGTVTTEETSIEDLAEKMVGQRINIADRIMHNSEMEKSDSVIFRMDHVTTAKTAAGKCIQDVSFDLHEHEIIGVAGVGGNGQEQLVEAIAGLGAPVTDGKMTYRDQDVTRCSAADMRKIGIAHITGERYILGISSTSDIYDNIIMGAHRREPWAGKLFMRQKRLEKLVDDLIETFHIKTASPRSEIMNLSGGNIQKCILARELNLAKDLIIAEEPTRGVDVGSQSFIHHTLLDKCKQGYGVILVSTDLDEVLTLSNVVYVMFEGRIIGKVNPEDPDARNAIGLLMAGIQPKGGAENNE